MTSATPDPAPSRRERRRNEIHERIIVAATELFHRKGFMVSTALEIAESADVAEKTFYNHFPTKQHLIAEIAQRKLETMTRLLADVHASADAPAEKLRQFCEGAADEAERSRVFTRELLFEVIRMAQVDGLGIATHRGSHRAMQGLFGESRAGGEATDQSDAAILSELGVAAFMGIILNWVTIPNYPLRERLRQLVDVATELMAKRAARSTPAADEDVR